MTADLVWAVAGGLAAIGCGLAMFLAAGRARRRTAAAVGLLAVLAGYFATFVVLVPVAPGGQVLPTVLFFGSLAVFRVMSRFESR